MRASCKKGSEELLGQCENSVKIRNQDYMVSLKCNSVRFSPTELSSISVGPRGTRVKGSKWGGWAQRDDAGKLRMMWRRELKWQDKETRLHTRDLAQGGGVWDHLHNLLSSQRRKLRLREVMFYHWVFWRRCNQTKYYNVFPSFLYYFAIKKNVTAEQNRGFKWINRNNSMQ